MPAQNEPSRAEKLVELSIPGRTRDIGAFSVRRVLPSIPRKMLGPFIFFDHIGPVALPPGQGMDVRPHPHIGLATLTYLFEGEIVHRDSLGFEQPIRPGDVNWMIAGRGIVHSERSSPELRASGGRMHGTQMWVALPTEHEEMAPSFEHLPKARIPVVHRPGIEVHVVAGSAFGEVSPTPVLSPTLFASVTAEPGAELVLDTEHPERGVYVFSGNLECEGERCEPGSMSVLRPGAEARLRATERTHFMLIGGAPVGGERHIFWNFVSSSEQQLERAKQDWRAGRFPKVPGDEHEFIPLPE
jgi:redox-sensitive bicupin YhaK (pirin superfamily)